MEDGQKFGCLESNTQTLFSKRQLQRVDAVSTELRVYPRRVCCRVSSCWVLGCQIAGCVGEADTRYSWFCFVGQGFCRSGRIQWLRRSHPHTLTSPPWVPITLAWLPIDFPPLYLYLCSQTKDSQLRGAPHNKDVLLVLSFGALSISFLALIPLFSQLRWAPYNKGVFLALSLSLGDLTPWAGPG